MTPMRMSPSALASPLTAGLSPFNDIMFSPAGDGILFSPGGAGGAAGYSPTSPGYRWARGRAGEMDV